MLSINASGSLAVMANLDKNTQALNQAIERLSSGQKINSAKDDAAGQAISNRMTGQIRGQRQAVRNANDGISMARTAEDTLSQINERLQRVRELTVQGINGTLNLDDQDAVQREINLNLQEIDRLNEQSQFNGMTLLDGTAGQVDIQIGANDQETLPLDLSPPGFDIKALGLKDFVIAGIKDKVTPINVVDGKARDIPVVDPDTDLSFFGKDTTTPVLMENDTAGYRGVFYTQSNSDDGATYYISDVWARSHDTASHQSRVGVYVQEELYKSVDQIGEKTIDDENVSYFSADGTELENARLVATGPNYFIARGSGSATQFYRATIETTDSGEFVVRARSDPSRGMPSFTPVERINGNSTITLDPRNVTVNYTDHDGHRFEDALGVKPDGQYFIKAYPGAGDTPGYRSATLVDSEDGRTLLKTRTGNGDLVVYYEMRKDRATTEVPDDQSVVELRETGPEIRIKNPDDPLATLDRAIARVDDKRSELGATENRLASAIDQQTAATGNLVAARSRIQDAGYAAEASRLSRAQILQQAGTAVLAQANQNAGSVLSLLR